MVAIVTTKSAHMPQSCMGHYRKVYVVDVPYWLANQNLLGKWDPSTVRSKDVYRVLRDYGPQSVGKTERCAYQRTIKIAAAFCDQYNNAHDDATAEQIIGAGDPTMKEHLIGYLIVLAMVVWCGAIMYGMATSSKPTFGERFGVWLSTPIKHHGGDRWPLMLGSQIG